MDLSLDSALFAHREMFFVMGNNALDVTINDQSRQVTFDRQCWFDYRHVYIPIDRIRSILRADPMSGPTSSSPFRTVPFFRPHAFPRWQHLHGCGGYFRSPAQAYLSVGPALPLISPIRNRRWVKVSDN